MSREAETVDNSKIIHKWEPWFFIFFGIFHMHRIWALIDRGSYLLFDLFAIATGMKFWQELLDKMFDIKSPYWNNIWGFFILLGVLVFVLGITLLNKIRRKGA